MKKVIFLFAMVLAVSFAMAQNTLNVAQTGSENDANVNQVGTEIYMDVVSTGNGNEVNVNQIGTELNVADPTVSGYVHQTGDANEATLSQDGQKIDFKIDQQGGLNKAQVDQSGSWLQDETLGLKQIRTGEKGNIADIKQANSLQSLDVLQRGSNNRITSDQKGNTNQFSAYQLGEDNKAEIRQDGTNNFHDWNDKVNNNLRQQGNLNEAYINQFGNSGQFFVQQIGNSNKTNFQFEGDGNWANIMQYGDENVVGGMLDCQRTVSALFTVDEASLDATQRGDKNKLYVSTAGSLTSLQQNTATVAGSRLGNEIRYTQTEVGDVEFRQIGDANLIWLKNTSASLPMDVDIDQTGNGNKVAQLRTNGNAFDCALFAGNHLDIDQYGGDNNLLNLNSTGAADVVDVLQNGSNNWASVTQSATIQ